MLWVTQISATFFVKSKEKGNKPKHDFCNMHLTKMLLLCLECRKPTPSRCFTACVWLSNVHCCMFLFCNYFLFCSLSMPTHNDGKDLAHSLDKCLTCCRLHPLSSFVHCVHQSSGTNRRGAEKSDKSLARNEQRLSVSHCVCIYLFSSYYYHHCCDVFFPLKYGLAENVALCSFQ